VHNAGGMDGLERLRHPGDKPEYRS
jgi:hypothetical protein